jgi:hypothetical protein
MCPSATLRNIAAPLRGGMGPQAGRFSAAAEDSGCERLMTVPGIGPIISSAMVAAIGEGDTFSKGRDFAAWLGLVPGRSQPRPHDPGQDLQAW